MLPLNASGTVRREVFVVANACIPSPLTNPPRSKFARDGHVCFEMLFYERRNPPPLLMRERSLTVANIFPPKRFVYKFF